jgi:O-antigen/teichoic acid export membrane protein
MAEYCGPLYAANLSFLSGQNMGKLGLGLVLTPAQLGFFAFAFGTVERIVEVVYTLPKSLLPSLTQIVAQGDRERLDGVFGQAFRLVQVVACFVSLLTFVFAREIVLAMGGAEFQRAIPLLRILALVPIVRTAQQPLTMLFQASRRPGYVLSLALVKLVSEFLGWIGLVLLVPLGAAGACWANLLGATAAFTGAMWLARGLLPEGGDERISAMVRSAALVLPLQLVTLAADALGGPGGLAVRALLPVVGFFGLFPLGLVVAYDLQKVSSLPLPFAWLGRLRDGAVAVVDSLIRSFGSRRPA